MTEGDLLTEIQTLRSELSIVQQRNRDLEADNAALAQRAALAVTQEADALEPIFAAKAETRECYRCGHSSKTYKATCECCLHGHTPDADSNFPEAT